MKITFTIATNEPYHPGHFWDLFEMMKESIQEKIILTEGPPSTTQVVEDRYIAGDGTEGMQAVAELKVEQS